MMKCLKNYVSVVFIIIIANPTLPGQAAEKPARRICPAYTFQGSWHDIGRQQGLLFFSDIITWGYFYARQVQAVAPEEVRQYYEAIKDSLPDSITQHMQGMAEGLSEATGLPDADAWDIVLSGQLFHAVKSQDIMPEHFMMGSAFAVASDNGTFLGTNYDDRTGEENYIGIQQYVPDSGDNSFLTIAERGFIVAWWAVNDQGLAVAYEDGSPNRNPTKGLPTWFLGRILLEKTSSLTEAIAYCRSFFDDGGRFGDSANMLLADLNGSTIARLQICSDDMLVTYGQQITPGTTYVATTNHFDDDFIPLPADSQNNSYFISSRERLIKLHELLPGLEAYNLDSLWTVLTDHGTGQPNANTICTDFDNAGTALSIIMTADAVYYTAGRPDTYLEQYGNPQCVDLTAPVIPSIRGTITTRLFFRDHNAVALSCTSQQGISLETYTVKGQTFVFNNLPAGTYRLVLKLHLFANLYLPVAWQTVTFDGTKIQEMFF